MIKIEKAEKPDLPFILEIENNSFSNPWSHNQLESVLGKTYCVKDGNNILGFISIDPVLDELHILHMAVHPNYRRKGIGKKMMEKALSFPGKKFFLEVRESNLCAQALYKSFGFKTISIRKNYYQDNSENALVMGYTKNG